MITGNPPEADKSGLPAAKLVSGRSPVYRQDLESEEADMLLENKNAVIYGGGGSIGGAVARSFAREGARVFLAARTEAKVNEVAQDIRAAGGQAETAVVDALDEGAVECLAPVGWLVAFVAWME